MKIRNSNKEQQIQYWVAAAEKDLPVMDHLFEKGDYHWALFIGHLVLETMLKALYVKNVGKVPPYSHRLVQLANKTKVPLNQEQMEFLEIVTDFNIAVRYPDQQFRFYESV